MNEQIHNGFSKRAESGWPLVRQPMLIQPSVAESKPRCLPPFFFINMNTDKRVAFAVALLLYGVLVIFVLVSAMEQYKPEWFHGGGDEGMAWDINWSIAILVVFVLDLIVIFFSYKRLIFVPLFIGLFLCEYLVSFIKPQRYLGKIQVAVQCDNHSTYDARHVALYSFNGDVLTFGNVASSLGKNFEAYLPEDGKVVIYWEKNEGGYIKQELQLWNKDSPTKNVSIILEENSAQVVGTPPIEPSK